MGYPQAAEDAGRVQAVELDAAALARYPDLARLLAYWEGKRRRRFAPRRADLDPADFPEILPRVMLADVETSPLDFRYRLSGTGIFDVHGEELTGTRPRELKPPAYGALIHAHYRLAVERRVPTLHLIQLDTAAQSLSYARLLLPLSEDGASVTMLVSVNSRERNLIALRDFFEASRLRREAQRVVYPPLAKMV